MGRAPCKSPWIAWLAGRPQADGCAQTRSQHSETSSNPFAINGLSPEILAAQAQFLATACDPIGMEDHSPRIPGTTPKKPYLRSQTNHYTGKSPKLASLRTLPPPSRWTCPTSMLRTHLHRACETEVVVQHRSIGQPRPARRVGAGYAWRGKPEISYSAKALAENVERACFLWWPSFPTLELRLA